jgi:8-oxo-dGTP pyrophosphatase MutT (NUDIX family)
MAREISAGGVVVRHRRQEWWVAVIEPRRDTKAPASRMKRTEPVLALPKGLVDAGERAEQAALREVREETGVTATPIAKLTDIKYVYVRAWSDGARVFKIVSFYLLRYESGRIGQIADNMRHEVVRAFWMPLAEAAQKLSYKGERDAVRHGIEYLGAHPELAEAASPPQPGE